MHPVARQTIFNLLLVAATTVVVFALGHFVNTHYLVVLYLIPITVAMLRSGFLHGLVTAFASALVAAFLFYQPVFSFYIADPEEAIELIIFGILGIVIAYLVTVLREISRAGPRRPR